MQKKMTYDELVVECTWIVMQGIVSGQSLKSIVHQILLIAINWSREKGE